MADQCSVDGCTKDISHRDLCGAHYQAAWRAGTLAPIPRKPRRVCPPGHRHAGSTTCYRQHGCRCDDCFARRSAENTATTKAKAYGRYDSGMVDAGPIRDHLEMLASHGIGRRRIEALCGVSASTVTQLRTTSRKTGKPIGRVKKDTADAILSVTPERAAGAAGLLEARGTVRRLQALIARGWSQQRLSRELRLSSDNMGGWFQQDAVTRAKACAVAAIYERLWDTPPPTDTPAQRAAAARSMSRARREGWVPPMGWDDIDIDLVPPTTTDSTDIDHVAVTLALRGEEVLLTPAERRACVRELHALRWSDGRVAEQLCCNEKTVSRIREELELPAFSQTDLVARNAA